MSTPKLTTGRASWLTVHRNHEVWILDKLRPNELSYLQTYSNYQYS